MHDPTPSILADQNTSNPWLPIKFDKHSAARSTTADTGGDYSLSKISRQISSESEVPWWASEINSPAHPLNVAGPMPLSVVMDDRRRSNGLISLPDFTPPTCKPSLAKAIKCLKQHTDEGLRNRLPVPFDSLFQVDAQNRHRSVSVSQSSINHPVPPNRMTPVARGTTIEGFPSLRAIGKEPIIDLKAIFGRYNSKTQQSGKPSLRPNKMPHSVLTAFNGVHATRQPEDLNNERVSQIRNIPLRQTSSDRSTTAECSVTTPAARRRSKSVHPYNTTDSNHYTPDDFLECDVIYPPPSHHNSRNMKMRRQYLKRHHRHPRNSFCSAASTDEESTDEARIGMYHHLRCGVNQLNPVRDKFFSLGHHEQICASQTRRQFTGDIRNRQRPDGRCRYCLHHRCHCDAYGMPPCHPNAVIPYKQGEVALTPIQSRSMLTCDHEFQQSFPNVYQGLCKGLIDVDRLISEEVVVPIKEEVCLHKSSMRSRWAVTSAISVHLWKAVHGKFPDPKITPRLVRRVADYFYDKIEYGVQEAEDERSMLQWLLRFDVENGIDIRVTTSMSVGPNSVIASIEGAAHLKRRKGNLFSMITKDTIILDLEVVIKALFLNGGQLHEIDSDPIFSNVIMAGENRFAKQFLLSSPFRR